jgi:hypothetical protein
MKRLLAFITLACICGTAVADTWVLVTEGAEDHGKYYIKKDSCNVGTYTDHVAFIRCTERNDVAARINLATVETTLASCRTQVGTLTVREFNGTVVMRESVVFDGGNVASVLFETLCGIAKQSGNLP